MSSPSELRFSCSDPDKACLSLSGDGHRPKQVCSCSTRVEARDQDSVLRHLAIGTHSWLLHS